VNGTIHKQQLTINHADERNNVMEKKYLLTPGPTPVPEEIQAEMAKPIIHHRTPQYREIFSQANDKLKKIFKTERDILTFTSSGTGAMEASVVNTLSKGDKAIVVEGGKFGERFSEICRAYGVNVVPVDVEWGNAPDPAVIKGLLEKNKDAKAVFMNLCETSTGTVYDVKGIAEVVNKTDAILVVDAISGLGADDLKTDEWNVDVVAGGSQKGLMIPPGLAFLTLSDKAWAMAAKSDLPNYYFNIKKYRKNLEKSDVPYTPALTLTIGLNKALSIMESEGFDNFIRRHRQDAEFVRRSVENMGLDLFSKSPSYAVTAVKVPHGADGAALIKAMKAKGVTFAGGQASLKGKIFRIAHMGGIKRDDLEHALSLLKDVLNEMKVSQ